MVAERTVKMYRLVSLFWPGKSIKRHLGDGVYPSDTPEQPKSLLAALWIRRPLSPAFPIEQSKDEEQGLAGDSGLRTRIADGVNRGIGCINSTPRCSLVGFPGQNNHIDRCIFTIQNHRFYYDSKNNSYVMHEDSVRIEPSPEITLDPSKQHGNHSKLALWGPQR